MRSFDGCFASSLLLDVDPIPAEDCTDPEQCVAFVTELCDLIHMKRHGNSSFEHFGEGSLAGWTVIQLIETSHVVAHFMDPHVDVGDGGDAGGLHLVGGLHLDVCSCAEFDPRTVVDWIESRWSGARIRVRHAIRKRPGSETGDEVYDSISTAYDQFYADELCVREDEIVMSKLRGMFPESVLDLGCGTGAGHRIITNSMKAPPRYYLGVDRSSTMLDRFWTECDDWKWSSSGARYYRDEVCKRDVTIDLLEGDLACEWNHGIGPRFDLILSLWSLSYLNSAQIITLGSKVKQLTESDTLWVMVLYGDSFFDSGRYLVPYTFSKIGDTRRNVQYSRSKSIVDSLGSAGWKLEDAQGITGPITRDLGRRAWRFTEWWDKWRLKDPFDHRWLWQVVTLRHE